jgi:hypothetical protein
MKTIFEFKGYRTLVAYDAELKFFVYRLQPPLLEADEARAEMAAEKPLRIVKAG